MINYSELKEFTLRVRTMAGQIIKVDSIKASTGTFFKPLWQMWKILGIMLDVDGSKHVLFTFYAVFINIMVSLCYPLHLCLMLFQSDTMSDNIKNLAVAVTCVACSTKFIIYFTKLPLIRNFQNLLSRLDARISVGPELDSFRQLRRMLRNIAFIFLAVYSIVGITAALSFVFSDERRLLYPARFPFNWRDNTFRLYLANMYQIVGITFLLMQNYVDDCFPAMALCVLSGHIKILSIRVSNIGYNSNTRKENEEEMIRCVEDQRILYELLFNIEKIISPSMLIQFGVAAINICVAMAALLFFVSAPLDVLYYSAYFLAMPLQIFPTCYYVSDFQYNFSQLHRAVFRSNWVEQSPKFKKDMIIFTERSLKENVALAGGMVRIDLDTFFATCKGAYSLFALIMQMK